MDDGAVLDVAQSWLDEGRFVALATVIETWGSAPRSVGSHLIVAQDGAFEGSVSGGCVEGTVVSEALEILRKDLPGKILEFRVSDQEAWDLGLACGGTIRIHVERLRSWFSGELQAFRRRRQPVAVLSNPEGGPRILITAEDVSGDVSPSSESLETARRMLAEDRCGFADGLFVRVYGPPWAVYVVGAVHIAQALLPMAELAGFDICLIDPRRAFATETRFPGVRLCNEWPDKALAELQPDGRSAIVVLTHDPKIDDPALAAALKTPAFYIGALGSRKNHERRLRRLAEAGVAEDQLTRIAGPVGLDLGGRSTGEIAVSIIAEIVGARYGRRRADRQ